MIENSEIKHHIDLAMMNRYLSNGLYFALEQYIEQQEKRDNLLELYQKAIRMMICIPQNETYHYVVRYTDDIEFNKLLNRIKALEEMMK